MARTDLRTLAAGLLLASAAILGAALAFQYLGGLQPCVLCIWQRYPYAATMALAAGAAALAASGNAPWARGLLALCGLVFLAGAGVALFHVGVEQHWWAGTSACAGVVGEAATVEELKRQLLGRAVARCDAIPWSFLGLSMAGWNLLLSLGLAAISFLAVFVAPEPRPRAR